MGLIDRAIKEIENEFAEVLTSHGYDSYEKADLFYQWYCDGLMKAIGILLDMEAEEPRWTPCSERLPEADMCRTLTTISTPYKGANVRSGCFYRGRFMNDNGDTWNATDEEVIAWMPLPEPYEDRREADEH